MLKATQIDADRPDLSTHLVGLRFSPGFTPMGRPHLSLLSRSREDIKDSLGLAGSNQLEQPGMKHRSQSPPGRSPGTRPVSLLLGTPFVPGAAAGAGSVPQHGSPFLSRDPRAASPPVHRGCKSTRRSVLDLPGPCPTRPCLGRRVPLSKQLTSLGL